MALTLLLLAGGGTARAQETNSASAPDPDPFLALERNNIFDQSRIPHDYRPGYANRPRVETITLCGIGVDDRKGDAIFQGSGNWFKAGETIKGLKIVRITLDSVTLADTNDDTPTHSGSIALSNSSGSTATNSGRDTLANSSGKSFVTNFSSNTFVLDMDIHPSLRREGDGPWRVSAYVAPQAAPATNSAATTTLATASGAKDNDIIAKLKKKREQEEK